MLWDEPNVKLWPLTASTALEVKNDHARVIKQGVSNKFIEVDFCVGCMVSQPNRLLHHQLPCLLSIRLEQLEFKVEKIIGVYKHAGKLRKCFLYIVLNHGGMIRQQMAQF